MPALEFESREFAGRLLNASPSPFDGRDLLLGFDLAAPPPPRRYVAPGMGPVYNQRNTGTCSAHGAAGVRVWQEKRDGHGVIPVDIFRLYDLVKNVVDEQPDPRRVIGTHIRSVMRLMKGTGIPLLGQRAAGAGGKIETYWQVQGGQLAVKAAIMAHGPLLSRADWDGGWMKLPITRVVKQPIGVIVGGHIFDVFGWDDDVNDGSWIIRNSWGRWSIGGNGNAYLAYRHLRFKRPEFWACTDVKKD